ncbi:sulfonate ABC transporter ATP-binding protein (plasmid) [Frondihabitans sp. PAMC 28766]|uniref:ABC transporter ATP-binding protein n=1 Tax=Frondihabitans sp. PAMC 28766 TaxID=1795630 RepID=UPI00078C22CA|nr:ABC transporter ATP-binding protein [Frondihabitans sp. PAMC 28766]AMM22828.1 sulfonate ABC transporter ATP-binding protein [Frondihabitans sp. PAMC 28766]
MKLEIDNVSMRYRTRRKDVLALKNTTFGVKENEFVSLVGVSGCGKSTLLNLIAGLQAPTGGEIRLDDSVVRGPGVDRGVVFQSYSLLPWLTAGQNIEFALKEARDPDRDRKARARELLDTVGLGDFVDAHPAQLSGGMRQRVAIARVMAYRPRVMLMDEPFGALDALTRTLMQELLMRVWEEHKLTVVFVTHDISEAVFLSDRVVVMSSRAEGGLHDIAIDLPRGRSAATPDDPRFAELSGRILDLVREEARTVNHF